MEKLKIYKAIAEFQQEVPIIHKATQGFGYSYADLPTIFPIINPLLHKHGLGFTQLIQGQSIETVVFHIDSGESLTSFTDIPQNVSLAKMNEFQVLGSAITYIRRYALSAILGIVTDKDTDAGGEQTKKDPKGETKDEPTEWLNLYSKTGEKLPSFTALEKAIAEGHKYTLAGIRKKYKVSKDVQEQLKNDLNII